MPEQISSNGSFEDKDEIQIASSDEVETDEFIDPPEKKHAAEHRNLPERRETLRQIVTAYGEHPAVISKLNALRKNQYSLILTQNERLPYNNLVKEFPLIKDQEVITAYFKTIEAGFAIWQSGVTAETASPEEQKILIDTAVARNILIFSNIGLADSVASKHVAGSLTVNDLLQEGIIALDGAVAGFDYKKGFRFSTYAGYRIKGKIKRAVANGARIVRLPVYAHEALQSQSFRKRLGAMTQKLTRELTFEEKAKELAEASGRSISYTRAYLNSSGYELPSLDAPISDTESSQTFGDLISEEKTDNTSVSELATARAAISFLLEGKELKFKEKLIICLRYGIFKDLPEFKQAPDAAETKKYKTYIVKAVAIEGLSATEIASILGITRDWVDTTLLKAIRKAHNILESDEKQEPQSGASEKNPLLYYKTRKQD